MRILTVAGILDTWQMLMELLEDGEWAAQPPYYFTEEVLRSGLHPGPVQQVWWHPRWIPFATDNAGNLTCLDLAPALGGVVGQILDWDHECGPSCERFPSFRHLLSAFVDQLEGNSGEQAYAIHHQKRGRAKRLAVRRKSTEKLGQAECSF